MKLLIYEILEKKMRIASGELYKEYFKIVSSPAVDRAYRNYMRKIVNLGLVNSKGKGDGRFMKLFSKLEIVYCSN